MDKLNCFFRNQSIVNDVITLKKYHCMEGSPDSDDENLNHEANGNLSEFRRLKRIRLAKKQKKIVFSLTPTPENFFRNSTPDVELYKVTNYAKASIPELESKKNILGEMPRSIIKIRPICHDLRPSSSTSLIQDPFLCEADYQEFEMFRRFILEKRGKMNMLKLITAKKKEKIDCLNESKLSMKDTAIGLTCDYGLYLKTGEGAAMAAFVKSDKRIPRRGEVGLSAEQIEKFEKIGYVMSGSRHARMNAIRMRKENQVYTAEEKAALAMLNYEEKIAKEQRVLADLRSLIENSLTT